MNDIKPGDKVQDNEGTYIVLDATDSKDYDFNKPGGGWELVLNGKVKQWRPVHNGNYRRVA